MSHGMEIIDCTLLGFLVFIAVAVAFSKDILVNTLLMSAFSLTNATLYLVMNAPDVAMTEAAVGAGFTTVLLLIVISYLKRSNTAVRAKFSKVIMTGLTATAVFLLLLYVVMDLPEYGYAGSPANVGDAAHYVRDAYKYTGIPNLVTSILASFRGYDTLCETIVILSASMSIFLLLGRNGEFTEKEGNLLRDNYALRCISSFMFAVILVYGFYVQTHGDYGPGGGFQSGVIFASAVVLYALMYGNRTVAKVLPESLVRIGSSTGVLVYIVVGMVSLILGEKFLSYIFPVLDPVHGQEQGVFIVESGVGLAVFGSFVSIYFDFSSWKNRYTLAERESFHS
ncbi:DUF4040 domain-containing protein [Anaplasma bovis]|uniref:DUF4040 domain-containing protein n=1 Tax=Anaplasma bovis TaxID=186733 RepID=UPI002FF06815